MNELMTPKIVCIGTLIIDIINAALDRLLKQGKITILAVRSKIRWVRRGI